MVIPETALIKYVYLDVVKFTLNRSVETQTEIISSLNEIVKAAVAHVVRDGSVIYIPIGDGICIALLSDGVSYDSHIRVALEILRRIWVRNQKVSPQSQFEVRIGINENVDNLITDINGNKNVAGAGVNNAQRIMSFADANQLLVSRTVYDVLNPRQRYMNQFRQYKAVGKHNIPLEVFQYKGPGVAALNREIPSAFSTYVRLSKVAAYYFAHAIKNRKFIMEKRARGQNNYALALLLWYLAVDSVGESESSDVNPYLPSMPETEHSTLDEQFDKFMSLPISVCIDFSYSARKCDITSKHSRYFEDPPQCTVVNLGGQNKLKSEWPELWNEFHLDGFAIHS